MRACTHFTAVQSTDTEYRAVSTQIPRQLSTALLQENTFIMLHRQTYIRSLKNYNNDPRHIIKDYWKGNEYRIKAKGVNEIGQLKNTLWNYGCRRSYCNAFNNSFVMKNIAGRLQRRCWCNGSLAMSTLSPAEAGQLAYEKRKEYDLKNKSQWYMDTVLAHAGLPFNNGGISNNNTALSPPLELASTFERLPNGEYPKESFIYGRMGNPTRNILEEEIAKLEITDEFDDDHCRGQRIDAKHATCAAFSSGMAAISAVIMAHPNCIVLLPDDCYHGIPSQLVSVLKMHGIGHRMIDMSDTEKVRSALEETLSYQEKKRQRDMEKASNNSIAHVTGESEQCSALMKNYSVLLWIETPSNPGLKITDIAALVQITNELRKFKHSALTVAVDSTWSPPCITLPLMVCFQA